MICQSESESLKEKQKKTEENRRKLRIAGILLRIGPAKGGHWEIIK